MTSLNLCAMACGEAAMALACKEAALAYGEAAMACDRKLPWPVMKLLWPEKKTVLACGEAAVACAKATWDLAHCLHLHGPSCGCQLVIFSCTVLFSSLFTNQHLMPYVSASYCASSSTSW